MTIAVYSRCFSPNGTMSMCINIISVVDNAEQIVVGNGRQSVIVKVTSLIGKDQCEGVYVSCLFLL